MMMQYVWQGPFHEKYCPKMPTGLTVLQFAFRIQRSKEHESYRKYITYISFAKRLLYQTDS